MTLQRSSMHDGIFPIVVVQCGKDVIIEASFNAGSSFFNYKNTHSIVLMAVVDAHHCFLVVDVGESGRHSNGGVLYKPAFGIALANAEANLPEPAMPMSSLGNCHLHWLGTRFFRFVAICSVLILAEI